MKIYRNIYIKGYKKIPFQKMTGRNTILYKGNIICGVDEIPSDFDDANDLYLGCDCDLPKYRNFKKI